MERKYTDAPSMLEAVIIQLNEYLSNEEAYGDNPQLRIDLATLVPTIDAETGEEDSDEKADYYNVIDLLQMSGDGSGKWLVDREAAGEVVEEYFD